MWIQLSNGRIELVNNQEHIARLLQEGGTEIADPRIKEEAIEPVEQALVVEQAPVVEEVVPDGTQNQYVESDSVSANDDRRPKRGKTAV